MQKWEYMCLQVLYNTKTSPAKIAGETVHSVPQIEKVINELGEQGWELTTTWEYAVSGKGGPTLFFKRPKS